MSGCIRSARWYRRVHRLGLALVTPGGGGMLLCAHTITAIVPNGRITLASSVSTSAAGKLADASVNSDRVAVGILEHERPADRCVERVHQKGDASGFEPIMQLLRVLNPQRDRNAASQMSGPICRPSW
jgi:hypothetical protein